MGDMIIDEEDVFRDAYQGAPQPQPHTERERGEIMNVLF